MGTPWVMLSPSRPVIAPGTPPVTITTTGSTFSPQVTAPSTVTVSWNWSGGSATGTAPAINFGSVATRTVYMTAADASGNNALNQVTVFNIGFSHLDDQGTYSLPAAYDLAAQSVSGISNVNSMTGLVYFLAADNVGLTGPVIFDGMTRLRNIECYASSFTSATINGCAALQRIVIEQNKLTTFDPTPAAGTLGELRLAFQQGGALALPASLPSFPNLYHWCLRDQTVTNMPSFSSGFPALTQLWIWNTGQSGSLTVRSNVAMDSVLAHDNAYTSFDVASQFPYVSGQYTGQIAMANNALTSVTITGDALLYSIDFKTNSLPQAQVDSILTTANGFGSTNAAAVLDVSGVGNAAPSATGTSAATSLRGRGWTVTTN